MSGAAAASGFAYQHAQAIQAALRLAEEPDLARIRVEADNDAIDLEIWSVDDVLVEASQFKRRREPYTWGQQELIDELAHWSPLGVKHPDARYRFVTDGRLGPTGRSVRDALVAGQSGDVSGLADLMQKADADTDPGAISRASIVVDDVTYNALIARAQERAKALLPNVSSPTEADERSRWVALELLHMVTDRSGLESSDDRFIARAEVLELLSTPQDSLPTTAWGTELKDAFLASVLSDTEVRAIDLPCIPDSAVAGGSPRLLEDWTNAITVCLVGGGTGSGKSTALARMQYRMAEAGAVVLVADAEDYQPGRFAALMAAALNRHTDIGAHPAVGTAAMKDSLVTVAIDGVSELAPVTQEAMRSEIRAMLASGPRARLVLAGRDATVLRSMLNRATPTADLTMIPLDKAKQLALVANAIGAQPDDVVGIVRETELALGDVARNPLMLLLGVRTILLGGDAANPASVFRTIVRAISADCGYSNASQLEVGLGMAFSRLLDEGRRYSDTFGWVGLLEEVAAQLASHGHQLTAGELREFGSETGLVRVSQLDVIRPLHDAFADYLAAAAIQTKMATLPTSLHIHDRARVRYLSQIAGVDEALAAIVVRDLPFTAVNISSEENRSPSEVWLAEVQRLVDQLLPAGVNRPRIAFWMDSTGRRIVTVSGEFEGWWDGAGPAGITAVGWTFPLTEASGPLQVAIRIWQRHLGEVLVAARGAERPVPQDYSQSVQLLWEFSDGLRDVSSRLVGEIGLAGEEVAALIELAHRRLQFCLCGRSAVEPERDRSVVFREVLELSPGEQVLTECDAADSTWTGHGRVDSFVTRTPAEQAIHDIRETINEAVGRRWLRPDS